jgi:hypothetical protein
MESPEGSVKKCNVSALSLEGLSRRKFPWDSRAIGCEREPMSNTTLPDPQAQSCSLPRAAGPVLPRTPAPANDVPPRGADQAGTVSQKYR